jgi:hypothetical protein
VAAATLPGTATPSGNRSIVGQLMLREILQYMVSEKTGNTSQGIFESQKTSINFLFFMILQK